MTAEQFFFIAMAFTMVASSLMFIASKNMVHAVLYFLVAMLSVAGVFLLLNAPFLAATQVLVYAGAITVLILFVIMLTITRVPEVKVFGQTRAFVPSLAALAFFGVAAAVFAATSFFPLDAESGAVNEAQSVAELGRQLYLAYLYPFEIAAFLLLIALVAAVYVALGGRSEE